ncbi:MAG: DNA polymerase III subunit gamma/tau [Rhodospirillaceae bacterium]|jgi:DNA polymerase-3 subunit gamma/tau|nr:DNA polymerase III subunit gamma/tau [Rhodospirillaceae bacterium]MBT4772571.1 DNA polymerase III subunit gamma/tau [Rhodospirillaceae bacterium]MBT5357956.1 DNA polymerase III subunit gamma/tau [Rhodospirillaceae bacterium]MBT5768595.1 DNA polymerase III subunit gamma/tau [Rhodospirillaceae bacterium]MBT6308222.1 DNA polymerase III subunit gamma/tau [Rhodospirillaceae bacterium]
MTADLEDQPGEPPVADADESLDGSPTIDDPNQASFLDGGGDEPAAPEPAVPEPGASEPEPAKATEAKAEAKAEPETPGPKTPPTATNEAAPDYQVLARKYRPQGFDELIGQEALVRTLTNAFDLDRVAHAFILTGVRGVGKTTTARIIAKCLNALDGPTISPAADDEQCVAIAEDRHPDVIEVDAASRTGVDDIREILDGVRYRPVFGRYKVYIIDEVHMLSRHAFNALLKTLEEPPEHVKFIFATTEIRKVPVTVLSRCQRFDLRRVGTDELMAHFGGIADAEDAKLEEGAVRLIARAADGSVRDGLSLLDQAISAFCSTGATASEDDIRVMLGTADSAAVFDMFEALMAGRIADALAGLGTLHDAGADPLAVLQDLLELSHWITRVKLVPKAAEDAAVSELERTRGQAMAEGLSVAVLSRAWQMLLKGVGEVQRAPSAMPAAEMVLIRLAHTADMPSPGDIIKELESEPASAVPAATENAAPVADGNGDGNGGGARAVAANGRRADALAADPRDMPSIDSVPDPSSAPQAQADPQGFRELVEIFGTRREIALRSHLYNNVHMVTYEPGRLEFRPNEHAPSDLPGQVLNRLREWLGAHWQVSVSGAAGDATLAEQDEAAETATYREAAEHPVVRAALEAFPGASIEKVEARDPGTAGLLPDAAPADDDDETEDDDA